MGRIRFGSRARFTLAQGAYLSGGVDPLPSHSPARCGGCALPRQSLRVRRDQDECSPRPFRSPRMPHLAGPDAAGASKPSLEGIQLPQIARVRPQLGCAPGFGGTGRRHLGVHLDARCRWADPARRLSTRSPAATQGHLLESSPRLDCTVGRRPTLGDLCSEELERPVNRTWSSRHGILGHDGGKLRLETHGAVQVPEPPADCRLLATARVSVLPSCPNRPKPR